MKHVDVREGDLGVLRRALKALFGEQWTAAEEVEAVAVDEGRAIVDLRSTNGIDFAGTGCGSVGFSRRCPTYDLSVRVDRRSSDQVEGEL